MEVFATLLIDWKQAMPLSSRDDLFSIISKPVKITVDLAAGGSEEFVALERGQSDRAGLHSRGK
jgi:hypothetical protein